MTGQRDLLPALSKNITEWLLAVLCLLIGSATVSAQTYTVTPYARPQWFTNDGDPCSGCLLNAYTAGTTSRLDTYSDSSGTLNANPVVLDGNGRAPVYLSGSSYKFVLTDSSGGTTYWEQDNVRATHFGVTGVSDTGDVTFQVDTDNNGSNKFSFTDGTAVERAQINEAGDLQIDDDLTIGDATEADKDLVFDGNAQDFYVCLDDSADDLVIGLGNACGTTPALSFTDGLAATFTGNVVFGDAVSDTVTVTGMLANTSLRVADTNATHAVVITPGSNITADRILTLTTGDAARTVTISGDATIDQDVSTTGAPTFATVDTGQGANELYDMDQNVLTTSTAVSFNQFRPPQGRCTLTTATPVTTADVTAATTLYYALYGGNQITLYDGSTRWVQLPFTELSIAVPGTTNTVYDVFVDYTAGAPALEVVAWTNDTTRATALALQNGVYVQTGDTDSLYVCSFRTTGVSGQTEHSFAKRYVWNYYNRVRQPMRVIDTANSWTYTTATWRQANANAANQLDFVVGVAEVMVSARVMAFPQNDTAAASTYMSVGIGVDSTSATAASQILVPAVAIVAGMSVMAYAEHVAFSAVGRHTWVWLEQATAAGVANWIGDNGSTTRQAGMVGWVEG